MDPIDKKVQAINQRLSTLDPASVEAVALSSQRDHLLMIAEEREHMGFYNGPTGHGDICWSDADPGL